MSGENIVLPASILSADALHLRASEDAVLGMKREMLRTKAAADEFDIGIKPQAEK